MKSDPIAELRSPRGALVSVYADRPSPGGFGALLTDLVKPIRERSEVYDRSVQKSVRADVDRIHDLAERLEVDSAPAYAIFASAMDDVFVLEALTHSTPNIATLGPRPYLRPLRAAPRNLRSGIVVADRAMARTFIGFSGLVEELGGPIRADLGKPNYGGFSGYAEHTVRARAEEESARIWKEAGQRLLDEQQRRPFDYMAIGGHDEMFDEIAKYLHPYLTRLPRTSFAASPQSLELSALRSEVQVQDADIRRQRQEALAGRVCDTAWSGGLAVLGLSSTLVAANAQAIDSLVVAGGFTRPGAMCNECGHLTRNGDECPVCGAGLFDVEDVVAAAMDATISAGGKVHQIDVASPLDVEGIGALTRFPLPA